MDTLRMGSVVVLALLTAGIAGLASARDGHGRYGGHGNVGVRVVVDPFWFAPGYYPYPYGRPRYYYPPYYYPPGVVGVPAESPDYIERESGPAPRASAYWYYCTDPQGYYPEVKQCPGGWHAIPPRQPAAPDEGRR